MLKSLLSPRRRAESQSMSRKVRTQKPKSKERKVKLIITNMMRGEMRERKREEKEMTRREKERIEMMSSILRRRISLRILLFPRDLRKTRS